MTILRTIIRFLIIAIAIGLLVFLSISLFRLIPAGINQLASATVSLGKQTPITTAPATATTTQGNPTTAPVTEDGLNGVYDNKGDIVILDEPTKTPAKTTSYTAPKKTTSYTAPKTYYTTYTQPQYVNVGGKNLKITFTSIGVIRNGQYITTNTFQTTDTVSMRFTILNVERSPTGTWAMRVEMPAGLGADKVKILDNLNSISGQSSYTGEVRFDGIDLSAGTPVIRIFLDIYNQVAETNEADNTLAIEMRNVTNNNYNNNNYNNGYWSNGYYYTYNTYNNGYDTNYTHNCFNGTYYYNCNDYNNGSNNGTQPNLYISTLELGKLVNGSFVAQTTFNYGDIIVVRARVRNNGGYMNSSWSTRLNIFDTNNYSRDMNGGSQPSLSSNSETTVTYELTNLVRGNNRLIFYVDSLNNVSESNEGDNSITQNIQVY